MFLRDETAHWTIQDLVCPMYTRTRPHLPTLRSVCIYHHQALLPFAHVRLNLVHFTPVHSSLKVIYQGATELFHSFYIFNCKTESPNHILLVMLPQHNKIHQRYD